MLLWLLRGCFAALMLGVAVFAFEFIYTEFQMVAGAVAAALAVIAVGTVVIYTDIRETGHKGSGGGSDIGPHERRYQQIPGLIDGSPRQIAAVVDE